MTTPPLKIADLLERSFRAGSSDLALARQLAEEALALSVHDESAHLQALSLIGMCLLYEGKYQAALTTLLQVTTTYSQQDDEWLVLAYYHLGMCYHQLSLFTEASESHQKQYELAEKQANKVLMASALRRMGADLDHLNLPLRALEFYERSLNLYQMIGDVGGMAGVYNNMSIANRLLGNFEQSLFYAEKSLPLFEQVVNFAGLSQVNGNLARAFLALGNLEKALFYSLKSFEFSQRTGRHLVMLAAYQRTAMIYRQMGRFEDALVQLNNALDLIRTSGDPNMGIEVHEEAYRYYEQLGNFEKAFFHHQEYHRLRVRQLEDAMQSRFESLTILHQTQAAQEETARLRQLREQDRHYFETLNQMKDELMSTASHDLKSPLASIMTVVYLIKKHGQIDDTYGKNLLERIENSAKQMRDLITNLLDLARIETGKSLILVEQDLVGFAREIADEFELSAKNQGIQFTFQSPLELAVLPFDALMLRRVFTNLLSNALKFTEKGGSVDLQLSQQDKFFSISVKDTGIGMPSAALPHIFERFYRVNGMNQTKVEGTGLGLPICKAIIEQHGGKIGVESVEGQGSRFWFQLPLKDS